MKKNLQKLFLAAIFSVIASAQLQAMEMRTLNSSQGGQHCLVETYYQSFSSFIELVETEHCAAADLFSQLATRELFAPDQLEKLGLIAKFHATEELFFKGQMIKNSTDIKAFLEACGSEALDRLKVAKKFTIALRESPFNADLSSSLEAAERINDNLICLHQIIVLLENGKPKSLTKAADSLNQIALEILSTTGDKLLAKKFTNLAYHIKNGIKR